jgi:Uma2 family endonuclease
MAHARKTATYDDILALPENVVGELVAGELHVSPRPAVPHAVVASTIGMDVGSWFQRGRGGPGGWWILDEPELHFGADVLVPDLAGWRRERMSAPPSGAAIELPPDWVCEVLSPSTVRFDRTAKLAVYARVGVP